MEKQKNIPHLRFPEFKSEWENVELGEISIVSAGGTPSTSKSEYWNGNIRWMNSGELNLKRVYEVKNRITKKGLKNSSTKLIPKYCVLIGLAGQGKTRGTIAMNMIELCTNQSIASIYPNSKKYDSEFLYHNLDNRYEELRKLSTGDGGRGGLNLQIIKSLNIFLPSVPEQKRTASFFTELDKKIKELKQKKVLLEQYKKGIMQKLFSQEFRFKDDRGKEFPKWVKKELGEVLNYEQPTKYLVSNTEYSDSFEIPVLTAGKTFILGYTNETNGVFKKNLPVIIFDDFTTATKFVDFPFKAKSSAMKILLPKNDANIKFIYEVMQLIKYELGGHERHWISKYSKIEIIFPSPGEQTKIANFLSALDKKIYCTQMQIEKTELWKKGLFQKMFC